MKQILMVLCIWAATVAVLWPLLSSARTIP